MDADRFDAISRSLTTAGSRRHALAGLLLGACGILGARAEKTAAKNCKKLKGERKKKCIKKAKAHNATPVTPVTQTSTCVPNCGTRTCGPDGCDGSCGDCVAPKTCQNGECSCTPSCAASNACGTDGCGGSCGTCILGTCTDGTCICTPGEEPCKGQCWPVCIASIRDPETCLCCESGEEVCKGQCRQRCISAEIRDPDTCLCCERNCSSPTIHTPEICGCCYPNGAGPFQNANECIDWCCSKELCFFGLSGWECAGRANGRPCTWDKQCASGNCLTNLGTCGGGTGQ